LCTARTERTRRWRAGTAASSRPTSGPFFSSRCRVTLLSRAVRIVARSGADSTAIHRFAQWLLFLLNGLDLKLTAMKAQHWIPSSLQLHRQPRRRTCELFVSCNLVLAHHLARVSRFLTISTAEKEFYATRTTDWVGD